MAPLPTFNLSGPGKGKLPTLFSPYPGCTQATAFFTLPRQADSRQRFS